jgi:hypothetical protein
LRVLLVADLLCGSTVNYSHIDVNERVLGPPFPVVHNQLLCLADVEGEVVVLAPHCQVSDPLPVVSLSSVIRPPTVVSSANLMVLELCLARLPWVNREYRRGLACTPEGSPC